MGHFFEPHRSSHAIMLALLIHEGFGVGCCFSNEGCFYIDAFLHAPPYEPPTGFFFAAYKTRKGKHLPCLIMAEKTRVCIVSNRSGKRVSDFEAGADPNRVQVVSLPHPRHEGRNLPRMAGGTLRSTRTMCRSGDRVHDPWERD